MSERDKGFNSDGIKSEAISDTEYSVMDELLDRVGRDFGAHDAFIKALLFRQSKSFLEKLRQAISETLDNQ